MNEMDPDEQQVLHEPGDEAGLQVRGEAAVESGKGYSKRVEEVAKGVPTI